jgi:hypothetical protein
VKLSGNGVVAVLLNPWSVSGQFTALTNWHHRLLISRWLFAKLYVLAVRPMAMSSLQFLQVSRNALFVQTFDSDKVNDLDDDCRGNAGKFTDSCDHQNAKI